MELMRAAGLDVSIDPAGNIVGRRAGRERALPPLMTGSHIDSVPEGGAYDGCVGSMAAVEVAHALADGGVDLRHPLEVVIFQNEENGKVGSRAMEGEDPASYLELMTHSGKTVREGIRFIGGDPDRVAEARRAPGSIAAFVELHIEQGDVLEIAGVPIGVVEGIVGIKRWLVDVEGFANHAGTTPMDRRQDALLAAARFVDAVHRIARAEPGRHVATVGRLDARPGAPNVIAGRAQLTLEMRDLDLARVDAIFGMMRAAAERIGAETGTRFAYREIYLTHPARADDGVRAVIAAAAAALGLRTMSLPSGAGHDAQEIARLAPMGMIFVPSIRGISHSAEESSRPADIEAGANVLLHTLLALDER
jgi:N-carbamoyl-L-amino-acid hydrolase